MNNEGELNQVKVVRPTWARWVTRVMLLACGVLMIVVSLSQPKIIAMFQSGVENVSAYLPGQDTSVGAIASQANTAASSGSDLLESQQPAAAEGASVQN